VALLKPQERIWALCREDKCGNYGRHYMCPPHVGSFEEIRTRLGRYRDGLLLQYMRTLDVRNDLEGVRQSKVDFHGMVLKMEQRVRSRGHPDVWGLVGGDCSLCDECLARVGAPCAYPDEARPSLESLAIDVLSLLESFGLDSAFHADKIAWTGCVLS
jgi:predicted metal-binding protein